MLRMSYRDRLPSGVQNTSDYDPGFEIGHMLWGLGFYMEIKKKLFKNPLVPMLRATALLYGMLHYLVALC